MGAWGYGIFDNDVALDWVCTLERTQGMDFLHKTLDAVSDNPKARYDTVCESGLAAADIVAALKGAPSPDLPEEAAAWVKANAEVPTPELVAKAQRACTLLKTDSELCRLWSLEDDSAIWLASVEDVEKRLA